MLIHTSYLVQRLEAPTKPMKLASGELVDNPFSFGGGYKNGGLSDKAMGLLREIFSFDYMGAAEFEFGAVPKALNKIAANAQADKLTATVIEIPFSDVAPSWQDKNPAPKGNGQVFILCASDDVTEVESRIRKWAADDKEMRTKERVGLNTTLRPYSEWDGRTFGWLELDNGFMFFTDRLMWEKTAALFGVEAP